MNFVTFDIYFIKWIKIIITIVHTSHEILIKECFVQSPVGEVDLPFLTFL